MSRTRPHLTPLGRVTATVLSVSGVVHLVRPQVFYGLIPRPLPVRRTVEVSGIAELASGLAVLHPRTRRIGGPFAALVLLVVWVGNVEMARRAWKGSSAILRWGTLARLPLQVSLIRSMWALR